jgi:hypothetical protein
MSDLTAKFSTLEAEMTSIGDEAHLQRASIETTLENIQSGLASINSDMLLMRQALLAAIGQNNPCISCDGHSLIVDPPTSIPVSINPTKCKRAQAFIHYMQVVFTVLDSASAFSIPFNPSLVTDAINQVITAVENGDTTPVISFPEAVQLAGDLINYVAGNFLVGGTLSSYFSTLIPDLIPAVHTATTAASAKAQYDAIVDASSLPSYVKPVIRDAAYAAIYSYYFDTGSNPNLTGYSGTVCGDGGCQTITSVGMSVDGGGTQQIIPWGSDFGGTAAISGHTATGNAWATINMAGYLITPSHDCISYAYSGSSPSTHLAGVQFDPSGTSAFAIVLNTSTPVFSVEVCPPPE